MTSWCWIQITVWCLVLNDSYISISRISISRGSAVLNVDVDMEVCRPRRIDRLWRMSYWVREVARWCSLFYLCQCWVATEKVFVDWRMLVFRHSATPMRQSCRAIQFWESTKFGLTYPLAQLMSFTLTEPTHNNPQNRLTSVHTNDRTDIR